MSAFRTPSRGPMPHDRCYARGGYVEERAPVMDGMTTSLAMEQAEEDLKDAPTVRQILRDLPSGEKPAVKPPKGDQQ